MLDKFLYKLIDEISYRNKTGIVNLQNEDDIYILSEILTEWGWGDIKGELIQNLLEKEERTFKNPILDKEVEYTDEEGNTKSGKVGNLVTQPKDTPARDAADKALQGLSDEERKKINKELGGDEPQSQPQDKKVQTDAGEDSQEQPEQGSALNPNTKAGVDYTDNLPPGDPASTRGDKEGDKKEKRTPEQKNVLEKEKNKTLKPEIDREYYDKNINPSDDEYEQNKPAQNSDTPTTLPEDIFGSPSKVPKKYVKLLERLINARYINDSTPAMTSMTDGSGAGKIQAQAGEVMSMIFSTLDDDQLDEIVGIIREHNSKNEIKKNGNISYKPPKYPKENQPVLTEDWIQSAVAVRAGIRSRLDYEYGKGNWEVEAGAWDLKDEVEAMGIEDYPNNKGFSTDMYLRIKNKETGESILDEVSLKKDLNVFLSQPSVNTVQVWALSEAESQELTKIEQRRAELKAKGEDKRGEGKKEDEKLRKREEELKELGMNRVPEAASPKVFNKKMRNSATEYYNNLSLQQVTLLNNIDDSDEGIKRLAKELNQSVKYTKQFVSVLKGLTHPVSRKELRQKMLDAGFSKLKTTSKYLDKFSVMTMRAASMMGDEESDKKLEEHLQLGKDFNKAFVENMVKEPYKTGMMNTIREKFPLKSLLEGEEKMSLGGVVADPDILERIFGTRDYDKVEENLTVDGPDENGNYQLVFEVEAGGEKIPLSTIAPRQRGLGYEPVVNLEMNLHPAMREKLYCANVSAGRDFPEKEELSTKYNCN